MQDIVVELPDSYAEDEDDANYEPSATDERNKEKSQLVFRRLPWACWTLGILNLVGSMFLLYRLTIGRY